MTDSSAPPNVTVVMIFLNAETFIGEAIESVLAQTYRDFELVLVDDGSTDRSTDIARTYAARFPELVRYTEHPEHKNLGMSASRNHGVHVGRGRLISFLDSDDIWLPNRLERFVCEFAAYPSAGMIYGPTLYWYSWAAQHQSTLVAAADQQDHPGRLDLPVHTMLAPPLPLLRWLETGGGCLPGICSLLVRREVYEAISGFEPAFRGLFEDQVFLSKIALTNWVVVIPDVLDYYRQHPDSHCYQAIASGDYDPVQLNPARARYLFWLERHCAERKIRNRALSRALRRELWPYRSAVHGALFKAQRRLRRRGYELLRRRVPPAVVREIRAWQAFLGPSRPSSTL